MNIDTSLRKLGPVGLTGLRDVILAQDDLAWKEDLYRQEEFDVHRQTESIVLLFVDTEKWPQVVVSKEPGWDRLADVALPLRNDITDKFYSPGGTVIRAMAAGVSICPAMLSPEPRVSSSTSNSLITGRSRRQRIGKCSQCSA